VGIGEDDNYVIKYSLFNKIHHCVCGLDGLLGNSAKADN
jgi:hypothetical protein